MVDIAANYRSVMERIEASAAHARRNPASIRLIAVTKTVSQERIKSAIECGILDMGENRLQEALPKQKDLSLLKVHWHFIGGLQSNKAKKVAEAFEWVHSIDRPEIARKLDDYSEGKRLKVLIEMNLGDEPSKSGATMDQVEQLVEAIQECSNLDLRGFMTVPPYVEDPERVRPWFSRLREEARRFDLPELSMGMSHDFDIAIEEGATMIRVGTALFGERRK